MSTQNQKPRVWRNVSSVTYFTEDAEYKENTMFIDLVEYSAFQKAVKALKHAPCGCHQSRPHRPPNEPQELWNYVICLRCKTLRELGQLDE